MTHYIDQQTKGPFTWGHPEESLDVFANGGTVLVEVAVSSTQWVTMKTYTANAGEMVAVAGRTIRITPANGAEYNFGAGI